MPQRYEVKHDPAWTSVEALIKAVRGTGHEAQPRLSDGSPPCRAFGGWLEMRIMGQTRGALKALLDSAPATPFVLRDGEPVEVPAHAVRPGETVLVKAGQRIPVDGEVTEGTAAVSEAAITGEPMSAEKAPGAQDHAGNSA
ncbi:MAG TPA: hypothetical protein PLX43_01135 [Nitrobacter sp.]|nr:hypothetical protein [Nitrobacter sp.]